MRADRSKQRRRGVAVDSATLKPHALCQNERRVTKHSTDVDRELTVLETELKRLENEYNMFFADRLPRPPWETRKRVEAMVKRLDRAHLSNYGERYRFTSLQSRFAKFVDLWDRAMKAREEGRPGPFAQRKRGSEKPAHKDKKSPAS
jgi:hypothetical protein